MARLFDGSSAGLYVNTEIITAYPFTVSIWFYQTSTTINPWVWGMGDDAGTADMNYIQPRSAANGQILRCAIRRSSFALADTSNTWTADTWQHAVSRHSASNDHEAILNGDFANKGTSASNYDPFGNLDNTTIGVQKYGSGPSYSSYMEGRCAECGMWDVALSDAEVTALSKGVSPLLVRPQSLLSYYPLVGHNSPETDIVGGHNMTLLNAPTAAPHPPIYNPQAQIIPFPPAAAPPAGARPQNPFGHPFYGPLAGPIG